MAGRGIFLFLQLALSSYYFIYQCYSETDTLQQGQELKDWDELISANKVFQLKLFSFGTAISPYLGIFYHNHHRFPCYRCDDIDYFQDKAIWVANRNNPIIDMYGKLVIDVYGTLSIVSGGSTVLDLFNPNPLVTRKTSATLLDSGNFVLRELYPDGSIKQVLWQSFDYPTDSLLPGMRLGINLRTGHRWSLISWRSTQIPADGSFKLTGDPNGTDQLVILRQGRIHWKSGTWQNGQFKNTDLQSSGPDVHFYYVSNDTEQSFTYLAKSYYSGPILRMYPDGQLRSSNLKFDVRCSSINEPGCAEDEFENIECRKNYHFRRVYGYIYRDKYEYEESYNLSIYDCKRICWSNCSCVAYTYANKYKAGCKTFGQMIYNPSETEPEDPEYYAIVYDTELVMERNLKLIWLIIGIGLLASILSCYLVVKKLHVRGKCKKIIKLLLHQMRCFYNYVQTHKDLTGEVHYFTYQSISTATNNFSSTNKLGEGGFGEVYKGTLVDGQDVAVKRLSRSSAQGVREFQNETELIAKLQHVNLVRLIGCCIEKQEKILVYEYMPNHSLDLFLFDPRKRGLLDWNSRFVIIDGIAQGLLYLHKFSRLRVIHRDLKAGNILLDDYMKPKISDFGMAKLFGVNEFEANTSRVVGTRGYMPPEYMMDGAVSAKTDVFSFGVLLLEIISSKMNHGSYDAEHPLSLLGHAWELWNEGRGLELMDPILEDSCTPKEVMKCIHVGLLCVQDHAIDRPNMSEVISMLTNENMHLPEPKQPAFFIERCDADAERHDNLEKVSVDGQSISIVVAR